jgi:hypothetical protein
MIIANKRPMTGKYIMGAIVKLNTEEIIAIASHKIMIENSFRFIKGSSGFIKAIMTDKRKIITLSIGNSTKVLVVEKNKAAINKKLRIALYTQL